jgi:phage terminase large subunit GpA-like protein
MRKHNAHGDYYAGGFYDQQEIIKFISSLPESVSQRLFTQFDHNLAREAHLKQGDVACPNCDHFFQNPTNKKSWVPQKGTLCRACQKPYILPSFGRIIKDAKRCSHCRAVILKSTGCNRVTCSLCYNSFSWDNAESLDSNTECDMCTIL